MDVSFGHKMSVTKCILTYELFQALKTEEGNRSVKHMYQFSRMNGWQMPTPASPETK